jgi:hypothetical protein
MEGREGGKELGERGREGREGGGERDGGEGGKRGGEREGGKKKIFTGKKLLLYPLEWQS